MRPLVLFSLMVAFMAISSPPTLAGPNANAKIQLHLLAPSTKNACTRPETTPPCDGIVTAGDLSPTGYFAYVLVTDGDAAAGLGGLQFGIDYDGAPGSGVDVFSWTLCGGFEYPQSYPAWPSAGGGTLITWWPCRDQEPSGPGTGVKVVVGYFYVAAYSPDELRITPRPVDWKAKVADCSAVEDLLDSVNPSPLGSARFSSGGVEPGYNPCGLVAGLNCAITGPSTVTPGTPVTYSVASPGPGASITWTVQGAAIDGAADQADVRVVTDEGTSFDISVHVLYEGAECTHTRTIGIAATIECLILGSSSLVEGEASLYSASVSSYPASYAWSIAGNGTIAGSVTGSSVSVLAGTAGTFTLTLEAVAAEQPVVCSKLVTVATSATSCSISGPGIVPQGTPAHVYSAGVFPPGTMFAWSISGNGTIDGSTTGSTVSVTAGNAGTFQLTVDVTSGTSSAHCERTVTVVDDTCFVVGPDTLIEIEVGDYTVPDYPGVSYEWSVTGVGLPWSSSGATARFVGAYPGWMTITCVRTVGTSVDSCSRVVRVNRNLDLHRNAGAAVLVHVMSPTQQNPCSRPGMLPACLDANPTGGLAPARYFAYVLVANGAAGGELGIRELDLGIDYSLFSPPGGGVHIFGWTPCGVTETPDPAWPARGSSNRLVWNECQQYQPAGDGITAAAGYFYLSSYTPDFLRPQWARVTDCQGIQDDIDLLGLAGFGQSGGVACELGHPVPVKNTTWGSIKALYAK